MTDPADDRDHDDETRRRNADRDRNPAIYRDYYERPTAISLFSRLGYDITKNEDVIRLDADLRYAAEQRKRKEEATPRRMQWLFTFFIAVMSMVGTIFGQWLFSKSK